MCGLALIVCAMTITAILVVVYITSHTTLALEIMDLLGIRRVGIPTPATITENLCTILTGHLIALATIIATNFPPNPDTISNKKHLTF